MLVWQWRSEHDYGVDIKLLMLSITFAVFHGIFAILLMYLEAKACKTSLLAYSVVCFNGRFEWVPYMLRMG